jgi:periplasmic protein TonB
MRTWTLFVSVSAHAAVIGAVIVAPLFAVGELPEPRRVSTWATVTPIQLPPEPVAPRLARTRTSADPAPVPLAEPPGVQPETPLDVAPLSLVEVGFPSGNGVPAGDVISGGDSAPPPPPRPPAAPPLRVGGVIQAPTRVAYVAPVYPRLALASKVEGTVILEAMIDEKGAVREVRVLRSSQLLDGAAVDAVRQWRFTPTLLNGQPVPVVMTVTVGFSLK